MAVGFVPPIRDSQTLDQSVDLLFEMWQGFTGMGTIKVVDVPILDTVFPERELLGHQGAVFRFLDGDDEVGLGQIGEREGLGFARFFVQRNAPLLESINRVVRNRADIAPSPH